MLKLELAHDLAEAGRARRAVDAHVDVDDPEARDALLLVVSELVTNAVRHGASPIRLTVRPLTDGWFVSVHDGGAGTPDRRPHAPPASETTGRGLPIVRAVAERWGAQTQLDGKVVWAELRTGGNPTRW